MFLSEDSKNFGREALEIGSRQPNSPGAKRPNGVWCGRRRCPTRCSYPCCSTEDVAKRTYDFTPFTSSTIGFEGLFDRLNNLQRPENGDSYPPYDIVRTGEDSFRISVAVAGFSPDDLTITAQHNFLIVTGQKQKNGGQEEYLYQGISSRAFERRFDLADHIEVEDASSTVQRSHSAKATSAP